MVIILYHFYYYNDNNNTDLTGSQVFKKDTRWG
ncbi:hypothetical protein ACQ27_gp498 [Klebsiella phage K64-1]|nr:hypothetical protein ACQ27_gp498 [Klebsiella phage K64-1]